MSHITLIALWPVIRDFATDPNSIVILVIGAVSGFIAQMILPGRGFGFIGTIVIGVVACLLGNKVLEPLHKYLTEQKLINYLICSTISSFVLMFLVNLVRGGRDENKINQGYN
jgi:uncharacterized membrane protein YeaQ/YmgE (transglycosylase-associated protein family)